MRRKDNGSERKYRMETVGGDDGLRELIEQLKSTDITTQEH